MGTSLIVQFSLSTPDINGFCHSGTLSYVHSRFSKIGDGYDRISHKDHCNEQTTHQEYQQNQGGKE